MKIMTATVALLALALPAVAAAAVPDRPMNFATGSFANNGEAVEHVTVRGDIEGGSAFLRFAIANAGYKKGQLTVTFKVRTAAGTLYGKRNFARGKYKMFSDRFGLEAGGNRLEVMGGNLVMSFDIDGVRGVATVVPHAAPLLVSDRDGTGWIRRHLVVPHGTLHVQAANAKGLTTNAKGTVFAVHEASNLKAHRSYDRSVQMHKVGGGRVLMVDYIVGPKERSYRPLGFVVMRGGGLKFAGPVTSERRSDERVDKKNDYKVPWSIQVQSEAGGQKAEVSLTASKQTGRKDDLAGLGFFARKAVAILIHPFTYALVGEIKATVRGAEGTTPATLSFRSEYNYAQARE